MEAAPQACLVEVLHNLRTAYAYVERGKDSGSPALWGGTLELVVTPTEEEEGGATTGSRIRIIPGGAGDSPVEGEDGPAPIVLVHLVLPLAVDPSESTAVWRGDHLEVKLRLSGGGLAARALGGASAAKAGWEEAAAAEVSELHAELASGEGGKLRCRGCGDALTALLRSAVELPSPHWQEMAEAWFCTCCGGSDRGLAMMEAIEARLRATPGQCQVGPSVCVLAHADVAGVTAEVPLAAAEAGEGEEEGSDGEGGEWLSLECGGCGDTVGLVGASPAAIRGLPGAGAGEGGGDPERAATLFKHRVSAGPLGEGDVFRRHTLEASVGADLLATSAAHAMYRFAVLPLGPGGGGALLQAVVLSWDTAVLRAPPPPLQSGDDGGGGGGLEGGGALVVRPVLKVMYRACGGPEALRGGGGGADSGGGEGPAWVPADAARAWSEKHRPEEIRMVPSEARALLGRLWGRTREYPPSLRDFQGFSVGFLENEAAAGVLQ